MLLSPTTIPPLPACLLRSCALPKLLHPINKNLIRYLRLACRASYKQTATIIKTLMSKRVKTWARKKLDSFTFALGACCILCGEDDQDELEKDCIIPRGDEHHKMSTDQRATFYWRELLQDNLQLLCKECHAAKTKKERKILDEHQPITDDNIPF